ncbi:hypothetical protein EDC04DRAFT_660127 [Pisolithus marmoratus]|nr:hypothetical protein EDC04DRAFT_660127 [Pisolithus marmoratus]
MASMLYIYVCFYSMGCGPLHTVYMSEIFPTRTRHCGLAVTAGTHVWLFSDAYLSRGPGLQTVLHVWCNEHWRYGHFCTVTDEHVNVLCLGSGCNIPVCHAQRASKGGYSERDHLNCSLRSNAPMI